MLQIFTSNSRRSATGIFDGQLFYRWQPGGNLHYAYNAKCVRVGDDMVTLSAFADLVHSAKGWKKTVYITNSKGHNGALSDMLLSQHFSERVLVGQQQIAAHQAKVDAVVKTSKEQQENAVDQVGAEQP
jgi:hypothetical protein